jgi:hypothetical protein
MRLWKVDFTLVLRCSEKVDVPHRPRSATQSGLKQRTITMWNPRRFGCAAVLIFMLALYPAQGEKMTSCLSWVSQTVLPSFVSELFENHSIKSNVMVWTP